MITMASIVAVFNIANLDATIKASGPFLRIVSCGLNFFESKAILAKVPIETRMIPVSRGPKAADGSGSEVHWRAITNSSLIGTTDEEAHDVLTAEYESINDRVASWNAWRESIDESVNAAARDKIMRPVYQVRAEYLLDYYYTTRPDSAPTAGVMSTTKLDRDLETSDLWCLVALMGSADYAKRKSEILDGLGEAYYAMLKENAALKRGLGGEAGATEGAADAAREADATDNGPEADERLWFEEPNLEMMNHFLDDIVAPVAEAIRLLPEEPLVSFFEASDDADGLNEKAAWLSKAPELKHADIAVVRMYTWLNLRAHRNLKLKHVPRGTNDTANNFFSAMRASMNN